MLKYSVFFLGCFFLSSVWGFPPSVNSTSLRSNTSEVTPSSPPLPYFDKDETALRTHSGENDEPGDDLDVRKAIQHSLNNAPTVHGFNNRHNFMKSSFEKVGGENCSNFLQDIERFFDHHEIGRPPEQQDAIFDVMSELNIKYNPAILPWKYSKNTKRPLVLTIKKICKKWPSLTVEAAIAKFLNVCPDPTMWEKTKKQFDAGESEWGEEALFFKEYYLKDARQFGRAGPNERVEDRESSWLSKLFFNVTIGVSPFLASESTNTSEVAHMENPSELNKPPLDISPQALHEPEEAARVERSNPQIQRFDLEKRHRKTRQKCAEIPPGNPRRCAYECNSGHTYPNIRQCDEQGVCKVDRVPGVFVRPEKVCDDVRDCPNGRDEHGCPEKTATISDVEKEFSRQLADLERHAKKLKQQSVREPNSNTTELPDNKGVSPQALEPREKALKTTTGPRTLDETLRAIGQLKEKITAFQQKNQETQWGQGFVKCASASNTGNYTYVPEEAMCDK